METIFSESNESTVGRGLLKSSHAECKVLGESNK